MNKFLEMLCLFSAGVFLWIDHQMAIYFAVMAVYFK